MHSRLGKPYVDDMGRHPRGEGAWLTQKKEDGQRLGTCMGLCSRNVGVIEYLSRSWNHRTKLLAAVPGALSSNQKRHEKALPRPAMPSRRELYHPVCKHITIEWACTPAAVVP